MSATSPTAFSTPPQNQADPSSADVKHVQSALEAYAARQDCFRILICFAVPGTYTLVLRKQHNYSSCHLRKCLNLPHTGREGQYGCKAGTQKRSPTLRPSRDDIVTFKREAGHDNQNICAMHKKGQMQPWLMTAAIWPACHRHTMPPSECQ